MAKFFRICQLSDGAAIIIIVNFLFFFKLQEPIEALEDGEYVDTKEDQSTKKQTKKKVKERRKPVVNMLATRTGGKLSLLSNCIKLV